MSAHLDMLMSIMPLVILIWMMTKKNGVPSFKALPLAALLLYLVKMIYFKADPNLMHATVLSGLLKAWTPILIVWGAIYLFRTMEYSGAMDVVRT